MQDHADLCKTEGGTLKPTLTLQGKWNRLNIGMDTIRALQFPAYICLLQSVDERSIAVMPCEASHVMSFRVPEKFLPHSRKTFTINSKQFVREMILANGLNPQKTYVLKGQVIAEKRIVVFRMEDCTE